MNPVNCNHPEFYDNYAYPFDEPHTIPAGWDAEAIMCAGARKSQDSMDETNEPKSLSNSMWHA
ncbi:MAG: hypothetical protein IT308_04410 [Anaerolineaceae bacterium]|nr:hypothetical protein [Anaerolineaceae bacterium]